MVAIAKGPWRPWWLGLEGALTVEVPEARDLACNPPVGYSAHCFRLAAPFFILSILSTRAECAALLSSVNRSLNKTEQLWLGLRAWMSVCACHSCTNRCLGPHCRTLLCRMATGSPQLAGVGTLIASCGRHGCKPFWPGARWRHRPGWWLRRSRSRRAGGAPSAPHGPPAQGREACGCNVTGGNR